MANKFITFIVGVIDDAPMEIYTVSSIIKETKASYTLIDDVSNSKYTCSEREHKLKKNETELDQPQIIYDGQSYPSRVFLYKIVDETLITDEFLANAFIDMKKILTTEFNRLIQRTQKKIDLLS